jgi:plasmid maintenance system killer protein
VWANRKLERDCSGDRAGARRFGAERWAILKRRLESLAAAPTLEDMRGVPGNCHPLTGNRAGQFAINVTASYRLVFRPAHDALPLLSDGGIDRRLVTRIRLEEVVDYHGD